MSAYYLRVLDHVLGAILRVEFTTERREITDYAVILLLALDGSIETIRVYDAAHGHNEMHRYPRSEGKQPGEPFHAGTLGEGMRAAIEGRSPYPERAAFIDADTASAGHEIKRAADEGLPVVLVAEDGSTHVLMPEAATR